MQGTDFFFYNKIIGWVLFTFLLVFGLNELAHIVYHAPKPAKQGMTVEVAASQTAEKSSAEAAPAVAPIAPLLAKADVAKGQADTKACQACHDFTKGGPNKVGPNLWGVLDRPIASHPGFTYSDALKAKSGDKWTFENLNHFIHKPKDFAPGTKMGFAGLKDDQKRADVILYLHSLSDNPVPLPKP